MISLSSVLTIIIRYLLTHTFPPLPSTSFLSNQQSDEILVELYVFLVSYFNTPSHLPPLPLTNYPISNLTRY